MDKGSKNRLNQKSRKKQRSLPNRVLPDWLRERGIATQRELVMALLPYMEWCPRTDLQKRFEKILPYTKGTKNLNKHLNDLKAAGLVEVMHGDTPPCPEGKPWMKPAPYAYYRRISKTCPRKKGKGEGAWSRQLDGTINLQAAKKRAQKKIKPPAPAAVTRLTMDDVRYIRLNPHDLNQREMSEMFGIRPGMVAKIMGGYIPNHLRARPAQSRPADNQAGI